MRLRRVGAINHEQPALAHEERPPELLGEPFQKRRGRPVQGGDRAMWGVGPYRQPYRPAFSSALSIAAANPLAHSWLTRALSLASGTEFVQEVPGPPPDISSLHGPS